MSKQLLNKLNGSKKGELKRFIDSFDDEISMAWYPSAGADFSSLAAIYLQTVASGLKQPDIFICSDYHASGDRQLEGFLFPPNKYENDPADIGESRNVYKYNNDDFKITCLTRELLPSLHLPLHPEIVEFPDFKEVTFYNGEIVFLKVLFHHPNYPLATIPIPVIYVHAENEAFAAEVLLPNHAQIDLIFHCVYGGGLGGGKARGNWLVNILKRVHCKIYIKYDKFDWQEGDSAAVRIYPTLGQKDEYKMVNLPIIPLGYLDGRFKDMKDDWFQID